MYHPRRGYSVVEAFAAVGDGWCPMVGAAWLKVTAAGGEVRQVKQEEGGLRIDYDLPDDLSDDEREHVESQIDEIEWNSLCVPEGENSQNPHEYAEEVSPPPGSISTRTLRMIDDSVAHLERGEVGEPLHANEMIETPGDDRAE